MYPQEERNNEVNSYSSSWLACCTNKFQCCYNPTKLNPSRSPPMDSELRLPENEHDVAQKELETRKPGGWKSMPFILGNESFERLASNGLVANFMVFLLTIFHMDQVFASNVINIWSGITNFAPLLGAYISDAYWGRFKTIAYASVASFLGMVVFTLVAWVPQLHPPSCNVQTQQHCVGATTSQFAILALGLAFLSIGSTGIRPCSLPFGVDQFDATSVEGRRDINSFFNWYYASSTAVMIIALTVVVYIQSDVSWTLGFGIPTICMFCATILFFLGTRYYVYVKPEGSVFKGIIQVIVASIRKQKLKLPAEVDAAGAYYDPISLEGSVVRKLPLTNQMRFFNKAALVTVGSVQPDGSVTNEWKLSSVQRVEETKCLFKIIPIWASGIICLTAMGQQGTFTVVQAFSMNLHMGPNFQIPPGSLIVISMLTIAIWLPIYDRFVVPVIRKFTKVEGGITLLQRMGVGIIFSILSMVVAGLVERMRRNSALAGDKPISVFWLAPHLILMGFAEAFNIIGQVEFYNKEFPENMSSVANSLFSCTMAGASYISVIVVNVVHNTTGRNGHPDWLTNNINQGRVDYFYFVIAGLGILNLVYFLWISRRYRYKSIVEIRDERKDMDVEMEIVRH